MVHRIDQLKNFQYQCFIKLKIHVVIGCVKLCTIVRLEATTGDVL